MKKLFLLTKTLLVVALLCVGQNAWGDVNNLYSQDFQSFAVDANFNTVPGYWQYTGANVQKIVENSGNKYLTYQTSTGATRNAAINFNISSFSAGDNWTVSFDASMAPGNNDAGMFLAIVGANGSATAGNAWSQSTGNLFSVTNAGKSSTSYTVNVGAYTLADAITLTSGSNYHYVLNWDGTNINLTITKDGEVTPTLSTSKAYSSDDNTAKGNPKAIFWVTTRYSGTTNIDNILVSEEIDADVVSDPTAAITGVSGTKRTVTITPGSSLLGRDVTTYYTTNGEEPTTSSSVYSTPLTISSSCTVKAVTISAESVSSSVTSLAVDAGTEVQLAAPSVAVTSMVANGSYYTPRYSISYDNSKVLLNPTSTLTATFNGTPVDISGGTFEPSAQGSFVVTATCEGYKSNSTEVTMEPLYEIKHESPNFNEIALANIQTSLGVGTWNASAGYTRWANWSKTGGVNADLTTNGGADYYYATVDANFTYDDWLTVSIGDEFRYLAGFGFGSNDKNKVARCSIEGAVSNSIAAYTYCRNDWSPIDYKDATSSYTIPTSMALKKVVYYAPVPATVSATIGAKGYTTFSSSYPLNLDGISGGTAYKVVSSGVTANEVTPSAVTGSIAAGEGLILSGEAGAPVTIPVAASGDAISGNLMIGCPTGATLNSETPNYETCYVLVNGTTEAEFKNLTNWIEADKTVEIPAGKAYLNTTASNGARSMRISFGNITGVDNVEAAAEAKAQEGKFIENGKLVIVKNGVKYNAAGAKLY